MRPLLVTTEDERTANQSRDNARVVREIYCQCFRHATGDLSYGKGVMPEWDGSSGRDHPYGRKTVAVWPKILRQIEAVGADPFVYMQAQFNTAEGRHVPRPSQLYNEQAVANWRDFSRTLTDRLRREIAAGDYQIQLMAAPLIRSMQWPLSRAVRYVLMNARCEATPLLKCCVAFSHDLLLPDSVQESAVLQYAFQLPTYDLLLGERIPQGLRATAAAYRANL